MLARPRSLIHWFGLALGLITAIGLVNILASMHTASSSEGAAQAINHAGSLRMQVYRIGDTLNRHHNDPSPARQQDARNALSLMEDRLHSPSLSTALSRVDRDPLHATHTALLNTWNQDLQPELDALIDEQQPLSPDMEQRLYELVASIDGLVQGLERATEDRFATLARIQAISLLAMLAAALLTLYSLRERVSVPLQRLMQQAEAVRRHDFSQRNGMEGDDELGRLGHAFDVMTEDLATSYQSLEARSARKTQELEQSHRALQLLHRASRSLFGSDDLCQGSVPLLQQLESLLGIGPVSLYLHETDGGKPFRAVTTYAASRPEHCRSHDCDACLTGPNALEDCPDPRDQHRRLLLPVRTGQGTVGTLEIWYPTKRGLEDHERQLLETLSDQLATAVYLQQRMTEEQRLTLMEERTVIARELHDSLAQSLSYLKMQVARLQKMQHPEQQDPRQDSVLHELRNGLNNAYRQLRELLTTFRLQLDSPGLHQALRETAQEFSQRLGFEVTLDIDLPPQSLSPNEEIHILQIVREALANVVKHAAASEVGIRVYHRAGVLHVRVQDNGRGLPDGGVPPSHYGLIIMRDRSITLGGNLQIGNRSEGGAEVHLTMPPHGSNIITQAS